MDVNARNVTVRVDELSLDGFTVRDPRLAGALAEHLGPALGARGAAPVAGQVSAAIASALVERGPQAGRSERGL